MRFFKRRAPEVKDNIDSVLMRLVAAQEGRIGALVTPDTCMQSPTVHAIVTAISRRLAVTPVHVFEKGDNEGRESKRRLPSHPVARLLQRPNPWQTRNDFWADAASCFVRHGNFYAFKARGSTGPIRQLIPLAPHAVDVVQDPNTYEVTYKVSESGGGKRELDISKMFHARGAGRTFIKGDSPVRDVQTAIALEILAEKFGATFFQNGALPLLVFKYMEGAQGFKGEEEERQFIRDFQDAFGGERKHRAMLLPKGIETSDPVRVEHDRAQFLETRKFQRTVIAGAFGVPPTFTGDLERATFNNVEQMDKDFTSNVVMPVAQAFEAAMERDLLTDTDRASGVCIRFNLDSVLRADFKSRQEGLNIQRQAGVISANEWREIEGKNPISAKDGGDNYWLEGPSGQNANRKEPKAGEMPAEETSE